MAARLRLVGIPLLRWQGVKGAMGRREGMQVVPMLGGARSAVTSPVPAAPAVLVKEAAPGPYMEGVTMRAGARVAGRTLAVTIARRSSVVGTTREESSSFRSRTRFKDRFHSSAHTWRQFIFVLLEFANLTEEQGQSCALRISKERRGWKERGQRRRGLGRRGDIRENITS